MLLVCMFMLFMLLTCNASVTVSQTLEKENYERVKRSKQGYRKLFVSQCDESGAGMVWL
jgi:hypothetical protein